MLVFGGVPELTGVIICLGWYKWLKVCLSTTYGVMHVDPVSLVPLRSGGNASNHRTFIANH